MTVYSKAKGHELLAYKHYRKDGLSYENYTGERVRAFFIICLVVVVVVVGSWRGGCVSLVFLKATIHVLKTYPPKLLVVFADEAI